MRIMDIDSSTRFHASDFSNSAYNGMCVFNRAQLPPVVVLMSKSSDPPHWRVVDGMKQMFYLSYAEAINYCKRMGYLPTGR